MNRRRILAIPAALTLLAACGSSSDEPGSSGTTGTGGGDQGGDKLTVVTSLYPVEYAIQRVGGEHVEVKNLTAPGAEPHDLELAPRDMAGMGDADAIFYVSGFQPAMDDAVAQVGGDSAHDVAEAAKLTLTGSNEIGAHGTEEHADEHAEETDAHADETDAHADEHAEETEGDADETAEHAEEGDEHDHDHGGVDPHFWLDTQRYGDVANLIAGELSAQDPDHKADYEANAKAFVDELTTLDKEFSTGLKTCTSRDLVTGHAAFGYLAQRYDFTQTGVSGISGGNDVSPARLGDIAAFVKEHGVKTIYTEVLLSPENAQTVATTTGAKTAVLDPLEGITDESAGDDYFEVMRANLATLKTGQECS